ncbi:unnamed protein product [Caenorhabditis sp. 36 PRJEB53466]|nr:unnamed protein product [Caenorhabditis sp. 36 PRJEB53466]
MEKFNEKPSVQKQTNVEKLVELREEWKHNCRILSKIRKEMNEEIKNKQVKVKMMKARMKMLNAFPSVQRIERESNKRVAQKLGRILALTTRNENICQEYEMIKNAMEVKRKEENCSILREILGTWKSIAGEERDKHTKYNKYWDRRRVSMDGLITFSRDGNTLKLENTFSGKVSLEFAVNLRDTDKYSIENNRFNTVYPSRLNGSVRVEHYVEDEKLHIVFPVVMTSNENSKNFLAEFKKRVLGANSMRQALLPKAPSTDLRMSAVNEILNELRAFRKEMADFKAEQLIQKQMNEAIRAEITDQNKINQEALDEIRSIRAEMNEMKTKQTEQGTMMERVIEEIRIPDWYILNSD